MLRIGVLVIHIHLSGADLADPDDLARRITALMNALPSELSVQTTPEPSARPSGSAEREAWTSEIRDVDDQLSRLSGYWPSFSDRLHRLHEGLLDLGYTAKIPAQLSSGRLASYISYLDTDGRNLGNTNSATFTFMRKELKEQLASDERINVGGRYATVHFDTEDKVDLILKIARRHKR